MIKFRRAKGMDIDLRIFLPDVIEQIQIIGNAQFRMMTTLHQDLYSADGDQFINFLIDLFMAQNVMVGIPFGSVKRAELAIDVADVRVVDVAISDISDDLVASAVKCLSLGPATAMIGQLAKLGQR